MPVCRAILTRSESLSGQGSAWRARCAARAAWRASGALAKAAQKASPTVLNTTPLLPSMSVKRKVTIPLGRFKLQLPFLYISDTVHYEANPFLPQGPSVLGAIAFLASASHKAEARVSLGGGLSQGGGANYCSADPCSPLRADPSSRSAVPCSRLAAEPGHSWPGVCLGQERSGSLAQEQGLCSLPRNGKTGIYSLKADVLRSGGS